MKYKNYRNSHTNEDKIYSSKNIADMSLREVFSRKDEIMAQHNSIGIPSEKELQSSDNVVYVQAYTKSDGTKVSAHWRSKPDGIEGNNLSFHSSKSSGKSTGGASEVKQLEDKPIVDVSTPEKVQKLMYPDEVAGVKRGRVKSLLEVAQEGVNPEYNPENLNEEYSINCPSTVFAADLQCRGFDVKAVSGTNPKVKELSMDLSCGYLDPKTGRPCSRDYIQVSKGESCYDYIQKKFPSNSRGILRYKNKLDVENFESDAHRMLVGKNKQGNVIAFDAQDNEYHEGKDAKLYLDGWININTIDTDSFTAILRIDDKIPNPYYMHEVVHGR